MKNFVFVTFCESLKFSRKYTFSKHCHVLGVLYSLFCPGYLSGWLVLSDLSWPICPGCLVPGVLSKMSCPVKIVLARVSCHSFLFQLTCPGNLVHFFPDATVMSWRSLFPGSPAQADLSGRPVKLPVPTVLSKWSCPRCPISTTTVVSSWLSYLRCPILAVMFWSFCLSFLVLSCLSSLALISQLSFTGYPVLAALFQLSSPCCPLLAVPSSPVPAVLSSLSCPCCPVSAVLY